MNNWFLANEIWSAFRFEGYQMFLGALHMGFESKIQMDSRSCRVKLIVRKQVAIQHINVECVITKHGENQ